MHKLVLIRHGESAWNKENRFTGWTDVELTDKGTAQIAGRAGRKIEVKPSPSPGKPPPEPLAQRKWRENRSIDELRSVIDVEHRSEVARQVGSGRGGCHG